MTEKACTTREKILTTAQVHFMRDGYNATSTRRISQEVGITQPNLYHHFKNKEALYMAVLERVADEALDELNQIKDKNTDKLEETLTQMTIYLQTNHAFNFTLMMNDMRKELSPEASRSLYEIFKKAYLQPFIDLFTQHRAQLRQDINTERFANHYFLLIAPYLNPDNLTYTQLTIHNIISFFLYGITKPS